jgi:hypothetical protein
MENYKDNLAFRIFVGKVKNMYEKGKTKEEIISLFNLTETQYADVIHLIKIAELAKKQKKESK